MKNHFYSLSLFVVWILAKLIGLYDTKTNSNNSQFMIGCDATVDNIFMHCRPENPGKFYVSMRIRRGSGDESFIIKDLNANISNNIGFWSDDYTTGEMVAAVGTNIMLTAGAPDEYRYYGPFDNGDNVNIIIECASNSLIQIPVFSGTYTCNASGVCTSDMDTVSMPFYLFDYTLNNVDSFLHMFRARIDAGCSTDGCVAGMNKRCHEYRFKLPSDAAGLIIQDTGPGSAGGELYDAELNPLGTLCSRLLASNTSGDNSRRVCTLGATDYIVLSCKQGSNSTAAKITLIRKPTLDDSITIEPCNITLTAKNATDPKWTSFDDPSLNNIVSYSGVDSSSINFLYNEGVFGPVTNCAGDTFHYIVSTKPADTTCIGDIIIKDTASVIVYPTFSVELSQLCAPAKDSIIIYADTNSLATGCPYNYEWKNITTNTVLPFTADSIKVPAIDGIQYSVIVTRADLASSINSCKIVADTITLSATATINCTAIPGDGLIQCIADTTPTDTNLVTFDGCFAVKPLVFVVHNNLGGKGCIGDTMKIQRLYISDNDRNLATTTDRDTCEQLFCIVDSTAPAFQTFPNDTTIQCTADTSAAALGIATGEDDNCTGAITVTRRDSIVPGICPAKDTILRVWKVADSCGNFTEQIQKITRVDTVAPVFTFCPKDTFIDCGTDTSIIALGNATAMDNCSGFTITHITTLVGEDINCPDFASYLRTFTAKDVCNNSRSCFQLIYVRDTTDPVITCPEDTTVNCESPIDSMTLGRATATDNCTNVVTNISFTDLTLIIGCQNTRTIDRIWTAIDSCQNQDTCHQQIIVQDTTPPTIICPNDTTVSCMDSVPLFNPSSAMVKDTCDMAPYVFFWSDSIGDSTCLNKFTLFRVFQAIDHCNNESFCTQRIFVSDTIAPVINGVPAGDTVECAEDIPAFPTSVTATDNCGAKLIYDPDTIFGSCENDFTILRIWIAMDSCNNMTRDTQVIVINDTIKPILVGVPNDTNVLCLELVPALANVTATDNCVTGAKVIVTADTINVICDNKMTIRRFYTAMDSCNNMSLDTMIITVNDTVKPILIGVPNDTTILCLGDVPAVITATATDNCATGAKVTVTADTINITCDNKMTIRRFYTAMDSCNNMSLDTMVITVKDTIAPMMQCPSDTTVACRDSVPLPDINCVTATDNCLSSTAGNLLYFTAYMDGPSESPANASPGTGLSTVIIDKAAMTMRVIAKFQGLQGNVTSAHIHGPTMTAMTGTAGVITTTPLFTGFPTGVTKGTYDLTFDMTASGSYNAAFITSNGGTTASAFIALQNALIAGKAYFNIHTSTFGAGEIRGFLKPSPIIAFVSDSIPAQDSICKNQLVVYRKYSATDACGNVSYCLQKITVLDNRAPMIVCPPDTTINCESPQDTMALGKATATDNCDALVTNITYSTLDGGALTCPLLYGFDREWVATDSCGNESRCIQTIYVQDTTKPLITCPADTTVSCMDSIPFVDVTKVKATDTCQIPYVNFVKDSIGDSTCLNKFTVFRTYSALDACNISYCTQKIFVNDTIAPVFTSPARDTAFDCYQAYVDHWNTLASDGVSEVAVTDNCSDFRIEFSKIQTDSNCVNQRTILHIWKAIDSCMNMTSDTAVITIMDTVAPVFMIPDNIDTVQCGDIYDLVFPTPANDNCDGQVLIKSNIYTIDSGTCINNVRYKTVLEFSATDACGNTDTLRDTIVHIDTVAPVITCPIETISLECGDPIPPLYTILDSFLANGGSAEDCCIDSASFYGTESSVMAGGMVTITQKYFISDCCGHMDSCTLIITIPPCQLDLAIKKEINAPTPFFTSAGGIVPFKITVYNQFMVPADSIKLIDYLPSPNCLVTTAGWINNGDGTACLTLSRANGLLPATGLLMGDSVVVTFNVKLGANALESIGINTAEIFSAQDTFHNTLDDLDSDPNSVPGDDAGGVPDGESDDATGGNGTGAPGEDDPVTDEDDQDPAQFFICQPFVCNDKINVSLDLNCQHCFSPLDIIKGNLLPESFYEVELFGPDGKKLETNCIGREYLGYKLTLSVSSIAPCPPNKCWGIVTLEDKLPPSIDCNIIDTVTCFEIAALPKGTYTIKDNCSGDVKVDVIAEQFVDYGCDSAIQGKIFRTLVARDVWGNVTNCTKQYVIAKITLDSVICPLDTVFECGVPDSILATAGVPTVRTYGGKIVKLTGNSPSCKITVLKKDEKANICGNSYKIYRTWIVTDWCTGQEKWCHQWIEVIDRTAPIVTNKTLPEIASDPHDCGQYVKLDTLVNTDCSRVVQTYTVSYKNENGIIQVINGTLPESRVWLPAGAHEIQVNLLDACQNQSKGWIRVVIIDKTPPTPVCDEFTQTTVDPVSCWAVVAAKDLDNGSHDNCVTKLHFAAALMSDIEKARSDYAIKIEADCGKDEYWNNKSWYDAYIEEWINCYVFKDTVKFSDCGSNQVVLRVYEADSIPRLDPHLFSCGPHAWFCYNTYKNYRIVHNASSQSCTATGPWLCKTASDTWYSSRSTHAGAFYVGSNPYPTRFPVYTHLYNDCMVNVLVDDKQAPVVYGLEDIVVYCDNAPEGSAYARNFCEKSESYTTWPGDIKDGLGRIHGYYGGSENVNTHAASDDHLPGTGCYLDKWSPIYCRKWLLLDSFDNAGKIDPKTYFDKVVLFDKKRPARTLAGNEFSFTDNCSLVDSTLKENITGSINGCGEGWLQKTWTIQDKCGNAATATQKVIVKHRSDFEVVFPKDLDVICGPGGNATDTGNTGKPIISDDECEQIGVQYKDEISTVEEDACYKIIRTWTLIDWCIYDPNAHTTYPDVIVDDRLRANLADRACVFRNIKDNGDGYIKYVQIIKVKDTVAPKLTCKDTSICITSNCTVFFTMPLAGTDNCAAKVNFRTVMTRPDNSTETKTNVSAITGSFISGTYNFAVYGNDGCGNESACNIKVEVKDCKAPTPYCLDALATVVMPSNGSVEIWARDFNINSEDNCTPKDKLKYSFTKNTADANKILACKDITNGREKIIPLDIYVTDEAGNSDFCKVVLSLQDNGGAPGGVCPDNLAAVTNVTGKLYTESKEGIENATVIMKGEKETYNTKSDGAYAFKDVYMAGEHSLLASRDDNPMNGISTLDLVLIQKHIMGTELLNTPYKMIAADVNSNNDISAVDLLELRKLVLGIYDKLPESTSWKFIPKSHTFTSNDNPWGYPLEDKLTDLKENMVRDFIGVKMGDVNSSAAAHSLMGTEIRNAETGLIFEVDDRLFRAGEKVKVEFRSPNFAGISGFQGTLQFTNDHLQFDNVDQSSLVKQNNIGTRWVKEGQLTMSWNENTGIDIPNDKAIFTITFTAQKDGKLSDVLRMGSQRTRAEAYEGKGELGNLSLKFIDQNGKEVSGTNTLYQNYPNPFDHRTTIGINLAHSGKGTLKIVDVTGRVVKSFTREWAKGYQEIVLSKSDLGGKGLMYYQFESDYFTANKRMIIMD